MKNTVIALCTVLATSLLIAGGNASSNLSSVAGLSAKVCNENKIYIEKDVQLMWQDQSYVDTEDGAFKKERSLGKAGTRGHAAKYCQRLHYAGYADWRLPTSDELINVHNKKGQAFSYFRDNDFWSSTPTVEGKYYVVFPADAHPYARSPKQSNYVRCVRCIKEN